MKTNPNDAAIKSLAHYNGSEIKTGLALAKMLTAYEENKDIVVREMTNIGVNEPERNFSNPNNWSASFYLTSRWEIKIPPKKKIISVYEINESYASLKQDDKIFNPKNLIEYWGLNETRI